MLNFWGTVYFQNKHNAGKVKHLQSNTGNTSEFSVTSLVHVKLPKQNTPTYQHLKSFLRRIHCPGEHGPCSITLLHITCGIRKMWRLGKNPKSWPPNDACQKAHSFQTWSFWGIYVKFQQHIDHHSCIRSGNVYGGGIHWLVEEFHWFWYLCRKGVRAVGRYFDSLAWWMENFHRDASHGRKNQKWS